MPGGVPPDKPLHQVLGADVQGVPGDILDGQVHPAVPGGQVHIDPGARQGVLAHIAQKVVQHPPQQTSVGHGLQVALVGVYDDLQLPGGELLAVVPDGLVDDLVDQDGGEVDGHVAGGRLAGLHQILRQLLQPPGLPVQHRQILLGLLRQLLLLQQVHIVDDGGEGRFDVVGDVGDELSLQPLGPHPLLHRPVEALADGVEVLRVGLQIPVHAVGVDLGLQVSLRQGPSLIPDLLGLDGEPRRPGDDGSIQSQKQEEEQAVVGVAVEGQQGQAQLEEQHAGGQHHRPPGHGEDTDQSPHPGQESPPQPPHPPEEHVAQGVAPPLAQLDAGGQAHEHRQRRQDHPGGGTGRRRHVGQVGG